MLFGNAAVHSWWFPRLTCGGRRWPCPEAGGIVAFLGGGDKFV